MTFDEQIEGVPLELVRQGWRRETALAIDDAWRAGSRARRWDYHYIESGDTELRIARPVIQMPEGPRVYAHQGWGDGLSPTPEMVKVWPYWWLVTIDGEGVYPANLTIHGDVLASDGLHIQWLENPQWRGPVLPPMEG